MSVEIQYLRKKRLLFLPLFLYNSLCAQVPQMSYSAETVTKGKPQELREKYGINKQLPKDYSKQVLIALSFFPELHKTRIVFLVRHAQPR
jgi:hypothetical protein